MYSPRIYLYKITFEEVSYYYYGVHKEKKFNEYYMGSPYTHKWMWKHYTPKKQILELFDYTDEGWLKAQEVEKRLIKPFYNTDKWCLNEHCGGKISLDKLKDAGKIVVELKLGIHGLSKEQRSENGKKAGKENYKFGRGWFAISKEERVKISRKSGKKTYELGIGIHGRTKEQMTENGKKAGKISGKKTYELGIGIHGRTKEQMIEQGKKNCKKTNSQKWMCLETGYVSTSAGVVSYQKARGIDTSKNNRKRIDY